MKFILFISLALILEQKQGYFVLRGHKKYLLRTKIGVFCAKEGIMRSGRGTKVVFGLECMQFGRLNVTQYVRYKRRCLTDRSSA